METEGRHPVCVLTRDEAIPSLDNIVVATVSKHIWGLRSEVLLGPEDGMPRECAISLDNLRTVPKALLVDVTLRPETVEGGRYPAGMAHATKVTKSEVQRRRAAAERMHGLFADAAPGRSLVDELIANRRIEARAEDREDEVPRRRAGR